MKVLIIGKVWPEPSSSAAGRRMLQLIELFSSIGEIHFACANQLTGNEIDFSNFNITTHTIVLNDDAIDAFFSSLNPAIVIFDRFLTEEQYGWRIIEQCPNALRILDSEDLHFLRRTRHEFVKQNNQIANQIESLNFHNKDTMRELASIYRCDLTLVISPFEMELLTTEMQLPKSLLYYLPIFCEATHKSIDFDNKKDFLFIGNYKHEPNADAINVLLKKGLWEKISKELTNTQLTIVGAYQDHTISGYSDMAKKVAIAGHVKSIEAIYSPIKISLAPLQFGAGIKGKIIESMEQGVPFITTSIGAEGLFLDHSWNDCIADDWDEFAQKALALYTNKEKWLAFQKKGFELLKTHFNQLDYQDAFILVIRHLLENVSTIRQQNYFSQIVQHHSLMSTRYLSKWIMEKNKDVKN
ncbi:MAG: glycosyltransferase [Crocinitomicaceae bacterium]|nr:glycosyltransferase [Crocinitomicaceae bacterium]